jgi:hypothetical protein
MGSWILENWSHHVYRRVFTRKETNTLHKGSSFHDELSGARGTELPPPFQLSILMFIFNKITLLFHLFFPLFVVFVSIYPCNLM